MLTSEAGKKENVKQYSHSEKYFGMFFKTKNGHIIKPSSFILGHLT